MSPPLAYPETLPEDNDELDESEFSSETELQQAMTDIEAARQEEWNAWAKEAITSRYDLWLKNVLT